MTEALAPAPPQVVAAPRRRELATEQLAVLATQIGVGVGMLTFSLVMARILAPGAFAALTSFGALYLLLNMPATSLTASTALAPTLARRLGRSTALAGGALATLGVLLALPLGHVLHLSPWLVVLLALAAPGAGPLAVARGRLYAGRHRSTLLTSLLAEPFARIGLGVALSPAIGATGGAIAIVAAGYASLAAARRVRPGPMPLPSVPTARTGGIAVAFLLLAVLQNQDVVLANAVLGHDEAGLFAVVSTIGGIAAFTTVTVPMVLLARIREGAREPLRVALVLAGTAGCLTVAGFAVAAVPLTTTLFGARYAEAGGIAAAYLLAMALLGVTRVLSAHLSSRRPHVGTAVLAGPALLQLLLIATVVRSPEGVAETTLGATALACAGTGLAVAIDLPAVRHAPRRIAVALATPTALAVMALTTVALVARLVITRGLWIDEASSVSEAELSFHGMLHVLRTADVHPPLSFALLWGDMRVFGHSELAVRLPSIAAGVLLVPVLYLAGRDLYNRRAGLMAAALAAIAPLPVWYSQEARMYALFMLLAALAMWAQVLAIRAGRVRDWVLYTASAAALVWTQYFALLLVAVQQLVFLLVAWRDRPGRHRLLRGWAVSVAAICVLVAPLVPFAQHQFDVNQASGRGFGSTPTQAGTIAGETRPSLYAFLANGVWAIWGYHADATMVDLVALWPLLMLLTLFLLGRGWSWTSTLLCASALLPALALFAIGQRKQDLFDLRYFIGGVPMLFLLAGRGLTAGRLRVLLTAVFAASLLAGLVDEQANSDNPRTHDFRGAVTAIEARARPGDVVVYNPDYLAQVVHYYGPDLDARALTPGLPKVAKGHRVFVLGSFFDHKQIAAATGKALYELGRTRKLVTEIKGANVRVWEFR